MNVEHPTSNVQRRMSGKRGDVYIDEFAMNAAQRRAYRKSYGFLHRRNLPVEIYRTERPIRRFIGQLFSRAS